MPLASRQIVRQQPGRSAQEPGVDKHTGRGCKPEDRPERESEHVAALFHGVLERHGLGPNDAALAIGGPADTWTAAGPALRRVRRSAGAAC